MDESSPDDPEGLPSDFWKKHQNIENVINHSNEDSEESYYSFDSTYESDMTDDFHFSSNPSTPSLSPATSPVYHEANTSCPNLLQKESIHFQLPIIPNTSNSPPHQTHNDAPIVGPIKITAIYKPDFGYLIDPKTKRAAKQLCQHCNKWISPKKGKKHIIMDRSSNCCLEYDYCSHCTIRANKWKGKITVLYSHASSVPIDFIFVDTKAGCDHRIQCEKCGQHKFCFSSHTCKKKEHSDFPHSSNGTHSHPNGTNTSLHVSNSRGKCESAPSLFSPTPLVSQKSHNTCSNSNPVFFKNNAQWNNHPLGNHNSTSHSNGAFPNNHNVFNNPNHTLFNNNGFFHSHNHSHANSNFFSLNANGTYDFMAGNSHANNKSQSNPNISQLSIDDLPITGNYTQFLESSQLPLHSNGNDRKHISDQIANFSNKMLNSNSLLKQQLQSQSQDQNKKLTPAEEMLYEVWSTEFGSKERIDEALLNQLLRKIHSNYESNACSLPTLASWKSFLVAKIVVGADNHLYFKTFEEWFGRLGPTCPEKHAPLWCWTFFLERVAQFADAVHLCKKTLSHSLRLVKSKDQKDAITLCWSPDHGEVEKRFKIKCGEDGFSLYKDSGMRVFSYRDQSLEKIILKFIEEHS